MKLHLFNVPKLDRPKNKLEELFLAYFDCRSNKLNTANALAFEVD